MAHDITLTFLVKRVPPVSPVTVGQVLTLFEAAQLFELNAAQFQRTCERGETVEMDGYEMAIGRIHQ